MSEKTGALIAPTENLDRCPKCKELIPKEHMAFHRTSEDECSVFRAEQTLARAAAKM